MGWTADPTTFDAAIFAGEMPPFPELPAEWSGGVVRSARDASFWPRVQEVEPL